MSAALSRVLERGRQTRAARALEVTRSSARQTTADRITIRVVQVGDSVFDTISGEVGEVIHVARENVLVPATHR